MSSLQELREVLERGKSGSPKRIVIDLEDTLADQRGMDFKDIPFTDVKKVIPIAEYGVHAFRQFLQWFDRQNVFLIVSCDPSADRSVKSWLMGNFFFESDKEDPWTIPDRNVYISRGVEQKLEQCRKIGATHFLGCDSEALIALAEFVDHLFYFVPNHKQVCRCETHPKIRRVIDWHKAIECVEYSLFTRK